ncbi:uncharacterized protein LOC123542649 [Mercenaria mercenaria]|uniref:uncharacterized protein LOC123542649 n=1 Tax=Mercenaria mercenaria TaxID=6596 RepID=UPI00234F2919|nr:uncharacterized protein LOC123542649 [Mercenaria mercenaria]
MHEEVLTKIRKFRADINICLDKAESAIISEMKQLMSDNDRLLDKLDNEYAKCASKIEGLKQKLDPTVHRENALFIQTVRSKEMFLEIEHELSKNVQSVCEVKSSEFVPNQQLSSIIKSGGKLGKLNISNINEAKHGEITNVEMNVDSLTFVEPERPKKPVQQETDRKTDVRPSPVFVGAHVQAESSLDLFHHGWQQGTVTAVHPDGTVDVRWNFSGETRSGYRVGTGWNTVILIQERKC